MKMVVNSAKAELSTLKKVLKRREEEMPDDKIEDTLNLTNNMIQQCQYGANMLLQLTN